MSYYGDGISYYYGSGGPFANHSSLMTGTTRIHTPLRFSPHLSTISETPLSSYRRYSPSILPYRSRKIIDTADIDVSTPRPLQSTHAHHGNRLRRDRPTIRIRSQALKDNPTLRDYVDRREKTAGELLVEKFLIKDKKASLDDIRFRLYRQVSLEPNKKEQEAIKTRITRRFTRRRSSADIQMDPEQLKREIEIAHMQAEVLDSLVAEEQAEIEVEVRKGTLVPKSTVRSHGTVMKKTTSESEDTDTSESRKKMQKKLKKRKKTADKPSPPADASGKSGTDEDTGKMYKIEASNSVGDSSTLLVNAGHKKREQFHESIKLPGPRIAIKPQKTHHHDSEEEIVVLPAKKPYVRDDSRNSVYLTLKTPNASVDDDELQSQRDILINRLTSDDESKVAKIDDKNIISVDAVVKEEARERPKQQVDADAKDIANVSDRVEDAIDGNKKVSDKIEAAESDSLALPCESKKIENKRLKKVLCSDNTENSEISLRKVSQEDFKGKQCDGTWDDKLVSLTEKLTSSEQTKETKSKKNDECLVDVNFVKGPAVSRQADEEEKGGVEEYASNKSKAVPNSTTINLKTNRNERNESRINESKFLSESKATVQEVTKPVTVDVNSEKKTLTVIKNKAKLDDDVFAEIGGETKLVQSNDNLAESLGSKVQDKNKNKDTAVNETKNDTKLSINRDKDVTLEQVTSENFETKDKPQDNILKDRALKLVRKLLDIDEGQDAIADDKADNKNVNKEDINITDIDICDNKLVPKIADNNIASDKKVYKNIDKKKNVQTLGKFKESLSQESNSSFDENNSNLEVKDNRKPKNLILGKLKESSVDSGIGSLDLETVAKISDKNIVGTKVLKNSKGSSFESADDQINDGSAIDVENKLPLEKKIKIRPAIGPNNSASSISVEEGKRQTPKLLTNIKKESFFSEIKATEPVIDEEIKKPELKLVNNKKVIKTPVYSDSKEIKLPEIKSTEKETKDRESSVAEIDFWSEIKPKEEGKKLKNVLYPTIVPKVELITEPESPVKKITEVKIEPQSPLTKESNKKLDKVTSKPENLIIKEPKKSEEPKVSEPQSPVTKSPVKKSIEVKIEPQSPLTKESNKKLDKVTSKPENLIIKEPKKSEEPKVSEPQSPVTKSPVKKSIEVKIEPQSPLTKESNKKLDKVTSKPENLIIKEPKKSEEPKVSEPQSPVTKSPVEKITEVKIERQFPLTKELNKKLDKVTSKPENLIIKEPKKSEEPKVSEPQSPVTKKPVKKLTEPMDESSSPVTKSEPQSTTAKKPIKKLEKPKSQPQSPVTKEPKKKISKSKSDAQSAVNKIESQFELVEKAKSDVELPKKVAVKVKKNKCSENSMEEAKEKYTEIILDAATVNRSSLVEEQKQQRVNVTSSENSVSNKKSLEKAEALELEIADRSKVNKSQSKISDKLNSVSTNLDDLSTDIIAENVTGDMKMKQEVEVADKSSKNDEESVLICGDSPVPVINILPAAGSVIETVDEEDEDKNDDKDEDEDDEDEDEEGPQTPTNEDEKHLSGNMSKWNGSSNLTALNEKEVASKIIETGNEATSPTSVESSGRKKLGRRKKSVSLSPETTVIRKNVNDISQQTCNGSDSTLKAVAFKPSPKTSPKAVPKPTNRPLDLIKMFYTTPASLLTATPRDLSKVKRAKIKRKKHSTPSTSSDSTGSSSRAESTQSNSTVEGDDEQKRISSTRSNDSGFDGSPRLSNCDMACHKKCERLTGNLCGLNQKLVAEALQALKRAPSQSSDHQRNSDNSDHLHASGRITPPATNLPRFKKYAVEDFNFLKVLGKGSFGKVLLAELRGTDCVYAVKCLKKDVVLEDDDVECTLIERKVLTLATRHPYLCHLFCTFQTNSHLFFVMEYLNGGDLMFHIQKSGRFPEFRARFYAAEIWSGLNFLHKKGIVYRDLKLDNVLLDFEGHIRIADFGMCKLQIFLDRTADTFCGTPDYMAPEIIKGLKYNQSVDWWSFGVLLYEMLTGQSPFSGCDEDDLFWSICNERPFIPRYLTQESMDILVCLLEKDAGKRPLGHEVQAHSFFHSINWDRLERRLLEPPFKPALDHTLDTKYFDTAFTAERPRLTPVPEQILTSMDQGVFRGFSYTNPNATD